MTVHIIADAKGFIVMSIANIHPLCIEIEHASFIHLPHKAQLTQISINPVDIKGSLRMVSSAIGPQIRIQLFSAFLPYTSKLILFSLYCGCSVQLSLQFTTTIA